MRVARFGWAAFVAALVAAVGLSAAPGASGADPAEDAATRVAVDAAYVEHCAGCHGRNGHATFPGVMMGAGSFASAKFWEGRPPERLASTIANGGAANGLSKAMPAFGDELDAAEIERLLAVALSFRPPPP